MQSFNEGGTAMHALIGRVKLEMRSWHASLVSCTCPLCRCMQSYTRPSNHRHIQHSSARRTPTPHAHTRTPNSCMCATQTHTQDHFFMSSATFPPHPHAGFNAITVLFPDSPGSFSNRDSHGVSLVIKPGGQRDRCVGRQHGDCTRPLVFYACRSAVVPVLQ